MAIYLKETMTAKHGYDLLYFAIGNGDWETRARVFDGNKVVIEARCRSIADYLEESVHNENFEACEIFRNLRGVFFIYWKDNDGDYITKIAGIREV